MRVAVFVVVVLAVATPVQASQSCMSKTEARRHFSSSHIYWHGPDHCWDATAPQHHGIHGVRRHTPSREAERKPDRPEPDQAQFDDRSQPEQVKSERSKWRDSMSAMLPDAGPALRTTRDARADGTENAATGAPAPEENAAPSPIASRWVDIVQVVPPPPVVEPKPEPPGIPLRMVLLLIAVIFIAGTVMVLLRGTIPQRPGSTTGV